MSLPRYPEYKNSGFDWATELPAHWGTASLKWLCQRYSGGTPDKNKLEFWEEGTIPWLNSGAVNDGRIYDASAYITQEAFENSSAKWIPPGALVMALAGQGKTKGMVAQLMFRSTCNQSMAALVPTDRINARCLYWWLTCNYQNIRNMAGGDLRDGLNLELLGAIPCPLPPIEEQAAIATFLDRETGKIDALIAEQEKLLALLAEKRQATISHAVTKGLNPDTPMKESGVAWLGKVPEHWEILKGARIGTLFGSGPVAEDEVHEEGSVPFIKVGSLSAEGFEIANWNWYVSEATAGRLNPYSEFVVFPKRGAAIFLNKVNIVKCRALIDPNLMGWKIRQSISSAYVAYLLTVRKLQELADVSTVPQINNKHIEPEKFPIPPLSEQEAIVEFVSTECQKIDALKAESERAIALLKERRSALIAAAVTGQIDVRGLVTEPEAA